MNSKIIVLLLILLSAYPFFTVTAQDAEDFNYVDIKKTNDHIAFLETENVNHTDTIAANNERKSFLENRIQTSETRLAKIDENIDYTTQTNLELNNLYRESKDRATKNRLDKYREELVSVVFLLSEEKAFLLKQTKEDKDEVEFLVKDTARRERLIEKNKNTIEKNKQDISKTESKNSEISSRLDAIKGKIDNFRGEFVETTP